MVEPVALTTDRVLLRPFELTDVDDVYAYARDSEWGRHLPVPSPYEHRHAVEFVARSVLTSWDTNPAFAMCLNGRVVGGINIRIDKSKATAEMGFSIAREHWGKGLTAEAARAVTDWAFGLAKITAMADLMNSQSWRVMEKLGMTREGVLRSERPSFMDPGTPGTRQDMVIYSVLREEWQVPAPE